MPARMLTVKTRAGDPVRRAAAELAPGLYAVRADRTCDDPECGNYDDEYDYECAGWCPAGRWAWWLYAEAGIAVMWAGAPFAEVKTAALELAALPLPWTTPDPAVLLDAAAEPRVRELALTVVGRLYRDWLRGEFAT